MYPPINKNHHFNHAAETNVYEVYKADGRRATYESDVHLTESQDGYHLELEIAGYVKDDFNFYINDNDLVLTTARNQTINSTKNLDNNPTKHSYCYASALFKKTFHFPNDIVKNEIFVDYNNHILSIDLLKLHTKSHK